jgi:hypothetical protein
VAELTPAASQDRIDAGETKDFWEFVRRESAHPQQMKV